MGGRGRSRTQRKHFKETRENVWKSDTNTNTAGADVAPVVKKDNWEPIPIHSPVFEEYYKEQGVVAPEEWDTFMDVLRKPLPAAFRINSSSQFCADIRTQLEEDFVKSLQSEFVGGDEAEAIRPLPWYPENLAWHANYSRNQLRKNQTLERFHEFLKLAHEIGNITRQEAVSMVPPLFLDVRPDHFVLDMCAAPGSKTFQLLEIIHRSTGPETLPSGMVVANDVDVQRGNLLIHQTKRMCTSNLIVTNHEAQNFPGCRLSKFHNNSSEVESTSGLNINQLLFDRVLCDVPCSGDGTLRKAPDIWRKWNAGMGNGVHGLQLKIAMRGLSLLKVGGRMVYSTCSMNPVENEAVVAEILRRCGDAVELLDVSTELPQLIRRPGLRKWKVRDKGLWLSSYKEVPEHRRPGILSSMFPTGGCIVDSSQSSDETHDNGQNVGDECIGQPTTGDAVVPSELDGDNASSLPLGRCMRIVPHDQNTGAFFIAVFCKHSALPVVQEKSAGVGDKGLTKAMTEMVDESEKDPNYALEAKCCETTRGTHPVDAQTDEASLEKECAQTLEDDTMEDKEALCDKETTQEKVGTKRKLQIQGKWKGVDPVILFNDETVVNSIKTFYGIDDLFPLYGHLVSRNSDIESVKRIYYISKSVKDVLELNLLVGQQLKIASVGLKMFERQTSKDGNSSQCRYRISSEGLPLLLPYLTKQILLASLVDFMHLLEYKSIKFTDFVDAEFGEKASKLELGCCVVVLREEGQAMSVPPKVDLSTIAIGCWKGRSSVNVMVTPLDCKGLIERLEMRTGAIIEMGAETCNAGANEDAGTNGKINDTDIKMDTDGPDMKDEKEAVNLAGV